MSKPRVFVALPLPQDLREQVLSCCDILDPQVGPFSSPEELASVLPSVSGVLTTIGLRFDKELISANPQLRFISNCAVGLDNIDIPAATQSGILVCNTPGVLDAAVADLTMSLILALARKVVFYDDFVRSGAWSKGGPPLGVDLSGKTLGLIGMGRIGTLVAQRAAAFGMNVVYYKRNPDKTAEATGLARYLARDQVFQQSDFISIHTPLTPETEKSIGAREFDLMKKTAVFINTSRGTVVDEIALVDSLKSGRISGAALDVMTREPLPQDDPLLSTPNTILQPHIGSATAETRRRMVELAVRNLLSAASNKHPEAIANPEVLNR